MVGEVGVHVEPVPPAPTDSDYEMAIQSHVDDIAVSRLFRDGVTLVSYTTSNNQQSAAEAQAFAPWRDSVWTYAYQAMALMQAGERAQSTIAEIAAELPVVT